jgi:hypothetical protein
VKQLAAEAKERARAQAAKKKAATSSAGDSAQGCNSFVPGTMVLLADGTQKPIEALEPGDEVLAADEKTGDRSGPRLVTAQITGGGEKTLVTVTIRDDDGEKQKIVATDEHPFWNPEKDTWVDAIDLRSGDWLKTSAGTWVQVADLDVEHKRTAAHNLTVDRDHTFYVLAGDTPVLVHNCDPVKWVDEGADLRTGSPAMSRQAYDYQSGATGARSNAVTGRGMAPQLEMPGADGSVVSARFDGADGLEVIDRKLNPVFSSKAVDQARRQAGVAAYNGMQAVWELPTPAAVAAANRFMEYAGVSTIMVRLVP